MSSHPLISHHLFVAAIEEHSNSKNNTVEKEKTRTVELEVLDCSEPLPDTSVRLAPRVPVTISS
jgi:hypothetical protein